MDVQNVKQEIDNHDDFLLNIDIKKDLIDEVSTIEIQYTNEQINGIHSIKQEINDDLNTNKIFDNNEDVTNKRKRKISSTQFIPNKPGYSKAAHRKEIKSKGVLTNSPQEGSKFTRVTRDLPFRFLDEIFQMTKCYSSGKIHVQLELSQH
ncbi:uncharacterized protein LOC130447588 isoform X2 [Diorhabda sublineata]|uniref:uncharacterized protein LOC130447588 isoform X2 n=1 Tax=Diorhabda sublineata TaxID=1163346 RepID=UPI0024E0C856|nr:uncharacterized protein LOC130447588 isoform X2 [Diorhabda sublineata]